ncbi:RusA family crossover junction endodeoxyribonuclease [Pediococcus pentosaceus]|uniref:RusA family crossover junction endodeoxyribonuclease n=1 Tax=Pediococcus pentosaceus TaxID=1255 RepID=UPI000C06FBDF|nr:RusA family crossover junction endodeoxyribonuclease [Pediococcus pentosaceus]
MIKLTIPGVPVAASRPQVPRFGSPYYKEPYKSYKKAVRKVIEEQYADEPVRGALCVQIKFYRSVQKSVSKVERQRRLSGLHRPTMKPDIDNLFKAVTDACTGIVWKDDNQIVSTKSDKFYSEVPRVENYVEEL